VPAKIASWHPKGGQQISVFADDEKPKKSIQQIIYEFQSLIFLKF
jgi:hypothetical protein